MSDPRCADAMLRAAERDLLTLRSMNREAPEESFGFHLQQAVEKALKAWIAALGDQYPLTHSIETLARRLEALSVVTEPFAPLAEFTPYAVTFRYEGVGPEAEPIDREAMIALVDTLLERVRAEVRSGPEAPRSATDRPPE